jgi:cation:H+ antiporter
MLTYILFVVGFAALIKGADFLVDGATAIAERFSVPAIVIGLTIVAFGTSMPELFVNIFAAWNGTPDIAIGNIIGSNIANILVILGVSALIGTLTVKSNTTWKEVPLSILALVVVACMANDTIIDGATSNMLSRIDGLVLISFFTIFLYYTFSLAKSEGVTSETHIHKRGMAQSVGMVIGGLGLLVIGGRWIVDGATTIATLLGMSEALIGLTVVAIGTSLPELATSAVAAYKGQSDIAIGNVAGSNIFNVFWILGISAIISPLPFNVQMNFDLLVGIGASVLLFIAIFLFRSGTLGKREGATFVALYIAYTVLLVMRG